MNVSTSNKGKWFYNKKAICRQYPAETMTDEDYADDRALPANTTTQDVSLPCRLKQKKQETLPST